MKQIQKRWVGLLIAPLAFCLLLLSTSAHAADYSGNCAGVTAFNGSGNVNITDPGTCTLPVDISATGSVTIHATSGISSAGRSVTSGSATDLIVSTDGGDITIANLSAGGNLRVLASSGKINVTGNVNSNLFGMNGNIWMTASGNIFATSISTNGGSGTGGVEIDANTAGTATPFILGAATANGIGTSINTSSTTGGGTAPGFIHGGVFITNGNSMSNGGITLTAMNSIQVNASASRSGIIILNAQNGTMSFPAGTLNSNGAAGQGAGYILLMAQTITTTDGTVFSASQDYNAVGTSHGVTLAAKSVVVSGVAGLAINADGNGITGNSSTAFATLSPQGSFTVSSNNDLPNLTWTVNSPNFFNVNSAVTVSGAAPLTMTANGNYGRVSVTGHPVNFTNKSALFQSQASTDHTIYFGYNGAVTNTLGFGFNTTSTVTVDVTAVKRTGDTTTKGGDIVVYGDQLVLNATTTKFVANGPATGDGDGGTLNVGGSLASIKATSKVSFSANAAAAGIGNAQISAVGGTGPKAIQFYPGSANPKIGVAAGQYSFSAKGGKTGGNAGTILISSAPVDIKAGAGLSAAALGGNGNGGEIFFYSYVQSIDPTAVISAIGKGTGKGGKFTAYYANGTDTLNINAIIKVDGGNSLRTAAENDFGRMTLNNKICQQRTTGQTTWPITYWNCANPDVSSIKESTLPSAPISLPSTFKTALTGTNIFIFTKAADFNSFFVPLTTLGLEPQGYSIASLKRASVFEQKGAGGTDISGFLKGALMHEAGHLVNAANGNPQGGATFIAAYTADMNNMKGNYPALPQSPTCMQVFNDNPFCMAHALDANPWVSMASAYIGGQPVDSEMFAFAFQTCSSYSIFDLPLDNVEFTNRYTTVAPNLGYMSNVNVWMNTYWPGGCH